MGAQVLAKPTLNIRANSCIQLALFRLYHINEPALPSAFSADNFSVIWHRGFYRQIPPRTQQGRAQQQLPQRDALAPSLSFKRLTFST